METYVTQYLAEHLGLTEQAAQMAAQALIVVVPWLAGLLTPRFKRWTAAGVCRVGGTVAQAWVTQPGEALAVFLRSLERDDVRYDPKVRLTRDSKPTDVPLLTAGRMVVEFHTDQVGGVREITVDDGAAGVPLLPILPAHEQEWAKREALKRRAQVIERDRLAQVSAQTAKILAAAK